MSSNAIDDLDIIEEAIFGAAPDTSEAPVAATSIAEANRWAGHLKRIARRRAEFLEVAEAQRAELDRVIEERLGKFDAEAIWFEESLREFHRVILEAEPDRTTLPLPAATLKKSHGGVEWVVIDEEALVEWAEENYPSVLAEEPDPPKAKVNKNFLKRDLKAFALAGGSGPQKPRHEDGRIVLEDGDQVPGVLVQPKPDKIEIVLT